MQNLARKLKLTGHSGKNKSLLIDHIIENANEQEITSAINRDSKNTDKKKSLWDRLKKSKIAWTIGIIGGIASIVGFVLQLSPNSNNQKVKTLQSISVKLDQFDPIKLDQIVKQLEKVNEELEAALKDEKSGNTQERKEALEAYNKGNYTKVQELFQHRIEKDKNNLAENYKNLGNVYYLDLKFKKALEAYNKSIEIKPDYANAWYNKGVAQDALGRHDEALEAYNKAIEIQPDNHDAWYNKGAALIDLGQYIESFKAFYKAWEIKNRKK